MTQSTVSQSANNFYVMVEIASNCRENGGLVGPENCENSQRET